MNGTQVARIPQYALEVVSKRADECRHLARIESNVLTTACRQHGLPLDLAELCGGILASMIDDLVTVGRLRRTEFERTKRKARILEATREPACSALKLAMICSPINGHAAVNHWDAICEKWELGKLAWLLGVDTETAYKYGKKIERRENKC